MIFEVNKVSSRSCVTISSLSQEAVVSPVIKFLVHTGIIRMELQLICKNTVDSSTSQAVLWDIKVGIYSFMHFSWIVVQV